MVVWLFSLGGLGACPPENFTLRLHLRARFSTFACIFVLYSYSYVHTQPLKYVGWEAWQTAFYDRLKYNYIKCMQLFISH